MYKEKLEKTINKRRRNRNLKSKAKPQIPNQKTGIGKEEEDLSSPDSLSLPEVRFPLDVSLKPRICACLLFSVVEHLSLIENGIESEIERETLRANVRSRLVEMWVIGNEIE